MPGEVEIERMIVRLMGDAQSYMKMMKDSQSETKKAQTEIMQMGSKIEAIGAKMRSVGLGLSLAITTPLVGLGYLAQSEFTEFEAALSRMEGLVGIAGDEVQRFRGEILSLAGPVAKSPVELAKAMEFITGSGIKGNAALETLTITAKAASAGLGETVEVANAVTSAMNAYGPANLSAAKATDILVATVREGKAEASSFAPVFGQVLPLAAEMGISFGEVGGALAFLTRTTGNASIATTQLRSLMTQLLKPTEKSTKALEAMGITQQDVSDMIKQRGLITTLGFLKDRLGAAGLQVKDMITDTEGLMGALQFTGPQAKIAAEMIKTVEAAAGDTQKAFDAAAKTAKFTFAQAMAETKIAMIELGEIIAPVMGQLISYQRMAMDAWKGLSNETKTAVVAFAAALAVIGPTIVVLGTVISSVGTLMKAYAAIKMAIAAYTVTTVAAASATTAMGLALTGGIIAVAALATVQILRATTASDAFNASLQESLRLNKDLAQIQGNRANVVIAEIGGIQDPAKKQQAITQAIQQAQKEILGYEEGIANSNRNLADMQGWWRAITTTITGGDKQMQLEQATLQQNKEMLEGKKTLLKTLNEELEKTNKIQTQAEGKPTKTRYDTKDLNKYTEGLRAQLGTLQSEADVGKDLADSLEIQKFKLEGASDSQLRLARDTNEAIYAQKKQNDLNQSAKDLVTSLQEEVDGLGLGWDATTEDIQLYTMALKDADIATLQEAHGLLAQKKALTENKKLWEDGKNLKKQWMSPSEKLQEEQTKLSKMLEMGAIDIDTYNKALKEAEMQSKKDYKVEFKTSGADAVAAGSAEAMERLREYQYAISGAKPLPMPSTAEGVSKSSKGNENKFTVDTTDKNPFGAGHSMNPQGLSMDDLGASFSGSAVFNTMVESLKRLVAIAEQQNQGGEVVEFVTSGLSDIRG